MVVIILNSGLAQNQKPDQSQCDGEHDNPDHKQLHRLYKDHLPVQLTALVIYGFLAKKGHGLKNKCKQKC